jgi:hypothetical protein
LLKNSAVDKVRRNAVGLASRTRKELRQRQQTIDWGIYATASQKDCARCRVLITTLIIALAAHAILGTKPSIDWMARRLKKEWKETARLGEGL